MRSASGDAAVKPAEPSAKMWTSWLAIFAFAVAMAWVEAACVYYLRLLVDRVVPYQPNPLPIRGSLGVIELCREAATLVMLAAAGVLAGRGRQRRMAYSAIAFGVWDIFYYVFLRAMSGWPQSIFDWDVLFLIPLPWWGPVLAPVSIAVVMIAWGTLAVAGPLGKPAAPVAWLTWAVSALGATLALYLFMADALHALPGGSEALTQVLPTSFNWPLFSMALALMAAPLIALCWPFVRTIRSRSSRQVRPAPLSTR